MPSVEVLQDARLPVFAQEGTVASTLPGQVSRIEKARRSAELIALGGELSLGFHRQLLAVACLFWWSKRTMRGLKV